MACIVRHLHVFFIHFIHGRRIDRYSTASTILYFMSIGIGDLHGYRQVEGAARARQGSYRKVHNKAYVKCNVFCTI